MVGRFGTMNGVPMIGYLSISFVSKTETTERLAMKYWEIIADNLSKAGWSWGCASAVDSERRRIWIVDVHRDGKRFIVRADEMLTAFSKTGEGDT
jgi:hypothetical protein